MALMGKHERMSAERAYELGMITEVVEHDRLLERAHEIADIVNSNAPLAVRGTRLAIHKTLDLPLLEGEILAETFRERVVRTEDAQEGPLAFVREAATELAVPMSTPMSDFETILLDLDHDSARRDDHAEPARGAELLQPHHVQEMQAVWRIVKARRGHQRGGAARRGRPGFQRRPGRQIQLRPTRYRVEPRGSR